MMIRRTAVRELPANYRSAGTLDLSHNMGVLLVMNILGLVLFFVFGGLFVIILMQMRPLDAPAGLSFSVNSFLDVLRMVVVLLLDIAVMIVLHEGAHGVFFALFTGSKPVYGFRAYYAFASAPGWYFPRGQYLVTCLAPFVLITALGFWALAVLPPGWFLAVLALMVLNASGAVGDLMVAGWLLRQPPGCLALDQGDAVSLFVPEKG
jgi:hypothetical protein